MPHAKIRRRCPQCQQMREFAKPVQKHCSYACSVAARGPAWWKAHLAKLTAARVARGYSRQLRRMKAAGLTDAQIALVQELIAAVRTKSHAAGRRRGFAEACGETHGNTRWRAA